MKLPRFYLLEYHLHYKACWKIDEIISGSKAKKIDLSQYKLKEKIGQGMSSIVYKAIQKRNEELKVGAAKITNNNILKQNIDDQVVVINGKVDLNAEQITNN